MRKLLLAVATAGAMSFFIGSVNAADQLVIDRNAIRFATLPEGVRFPEGITADPATGEIFVATFDFGPHVCTPLLTGQAPFQIDI